MDKVQVVNTFLKSVNTLRTTKCSQKEKIVLFQQIADCIISPSMQSHQQYPRHCSSATSALLFFAEDHDSTVRMNAEENLNRIFRSMEKTRTSRILIDLFGEIKKNGNQKSLRICLNLFAYYCPRIKEKNVKWYANSLVSCLQAIAARKETLLIETLCNFVKSYCSNLECCLNDSETLKLIDTFLCTITSECAVKRRCSSQNCISLIENSRNKSAMAKYGLNKAIDILLCNHQQVNTLLGIFGFLRLLMPIIIREAIEKKHDEYLGQIVEIYDLCIHYLYNTNSTSNHSIINASLEVINSILQSIELTGNALKSLLCNHQLHHNDYLKKRKSLKNQIFQLKTTEITTTTCNNIGKFSVGNDNAKMAKPRRQAQMSSAIERQQSQLQSQSQSQSQIEIESQLQPQIQSNVKTTGLEINSDCESELESETKTEIEAETSPHTSNKKKIKIICDLNKHKMSGRKSTKETIKDAFKLGIQKSPFSIDIVDVSENNVHAKHIETTTATRNREVNVDIDADGFGNDNDNDNNDASVNNKNNIEMRVNLIHAEEDVDKKAENVSEQFTGNEEDGKQYNIRHSLDNSNDGNGNGNGNDDDDDGDGNTFNPHSNSQQKGGSISGDNIIIDDDGFTTLLEINEPNEDDSLVLHRSTSGSIDDKSLFLSDIDNESFHSIDFESEIKIVEYTSTSINSIAVDIPTTKTNSSSLNKQKLIASSPLTIPNSKDSYTAAKSSDTIGSFFNNLLSPSSAETMTKFFRPSSSKTPATPATLTTSKNITLQSDNIDSATEKNQNQNSSSSSSLITRTKENLPSLTSTPNRTKQKQGSSKQHAKEDNIDNIFNQNEIFHGGISAGSGGGGGGFESGIGTFPDNISLDSINSYISLGSHFSTLTTNTTTSQDILLMKNEQDFGITFEPTLSSKNNVTTGDDISVTSVISTSSTILLDNSITMSINKDAECDKQINNEKSTLLLQQISSPLKSTDKSQTNEMTNIINNTTPRNTSGYNKNSNIEFDNISSTFIKFNIGTIYDQAILYYTVRFITAKFLLTGKFGELRSDENIRVSIKNLSLNVIANCVRLMPEVLFLSIEMNQNEILKQTNNELILSDLGEDEEGENDDINDSIEINQSYNNSSDGSSSNIGKDFDHLDIERDENLSELQTNPIKTKIDENLLEIKDDHFGKSTTDYFLNSPLSKSADDVLMTEFKRQTEVAKGTKKLNENFEKILSKSEIVQSPKLMKSIQNSPIKLVPLIQSSTAAKMTPQILPSSSSSASSSSASSPPPPLPPRGIKPLQTMSASYKKLLTQFGNSSVEKNTDLPILNRANSSPCPTTVTPSTLRPAPPPPPPPPSSPPNNTSKNKISSKTSISQLNIDFYAGHDKNHRGQCIDDILLFYNCPDPILRGDVQIIIGNFIESRLMMMTSCDAIQWNCDDICTRFDCCPLRISRLLAILIKGLQDDIHTVVIHALTAFDKIFALVMSKYLLDQNKQIIKSKLRSAIGQNSNGLDFNRPPSSVLSNLMSTYEYNGNDDDSFIESLLNFQLQLNDDDYKNKIGKNNEKRQENVSRNWQRSNFISPKLLLDKLRICYHNKYWLVQNKYAEVISNLNYKMLREYYGNDICSSYENLFFEELLQLVGDDDIRVRDHIANCLTRYIIQMQQDDNIPQYPIISSNSLSTIMLTEESLLSSSSTASGATTNSLSINIPDIYLTNFNLLREFCDYHLFQSMSPYLNDLFNSNSILPNSLVEKSLSKVLYRITNKLLELNNKNGQIGLIYALKVLLNKFNPVDYYTVWNEFNFIEICLNYLNSNHNFIVGDLSAQNDLIEVTGKLIYANIITENINKSNNITINNINMNSQHADNLFIHLMKILNIYYHLFGNQKPSLFVRAQKTDLFTNSKELAIINNIGYFGNDFVYFKFYNILNCAYESFKITINSESGCKLLTLLSTCINTLSLCIEMKMHNNFSNSIKIIEEILQYLTVLINYRSVECIDCLKQLLKFLFGQNYANRFDEYEKFTKLYFDVRRQLCTVTVNHNNNDDDDNDNDGSDNEKPVANGQNSYNNFNNYNNNIDLNKIVSDITITNSMNNFIKTATGKGYLAEKCDNGVRGGGGAGKVENAELNEFNRSSKIKMNLQQPEKLYNANDNRIFVELLTSAMNFSMGEKATTNKEDCVKHIKLFQPLVLHCLPLFLKTNSQIQAPILDLLSQLLEFKVTLSELDANNVIFDEVIKIVELIESGVSRNAKCIIPSIIKFLIRLTHQNDIILTTIPKIIGITNNLLANNSIRQCSVVALKCLSFELFFVKEQFKLSPILQSNIGITSTQPFTFDSVSVGGKEISIKSTTMTATTTTETIKSENLKIQPISPTSLLNIKETNTQKEVVFGMLEKFIDSIECQSMLGILLLSGNNKFGYCGKVIPMTTPATGDLLSILTTATIAKDTNTDTSIIINEKANMEMSTIQEGAIYSIVTKGLIEKRIKMNNWHEYFIVDALFKNSYMNIRLDSKEFASMLTLFIEQNVENFNDLSYATIILDNVILKTEEIYLVNHIKLYLKNHNDKVASAQIKDATNATRSVCCDMTSIGHKFGNRYHQRHQIFLTTPQAAIATSATLATTTAVVAALASVEEGEKPKASSSNTNLKLFTNASGSLSSSSSSSNCSSISNSFYDSFTSVPINEINYFGKVLYEKLDRCFAILIKSHPHSYNRKYCGLAVKFVSALNDISNKDVLSSVLRLALDKNDFWNKYKINGISTTGGGLSYEYQRLYIEIFKLYAMLGLLNITMMLQQIQLDDIKWNLRRTLVIEICTNFNNPDDWTLQDVECLFSRPFLNILINDNLPFIQNLCHQRKQNGCIFVNALINNCDLLTLQTVIRIPSMLLNNNIMEKIPIELKIELLSKIYSKVDTNKILQKLIERTIRKIIASHPDEVTTTSILSSSSSTSIQAMSSSSMAISKSESPLLSSIGNIFRNLPKRNLQLEILIFGESFNKRKDDAVDIDVDVDVDVDVDINVDGTTRQKFEQKIIEEKWLIEQIIKFSSHANAEEFVHILLDIKSELKLRKIFRSSDINLENILQPSIDISLKSMLSSFQNNCVQYNPHINYMNLNPLAKVSISILMTNIENIVNLTNKMGKNSEKLKKFEQNQYVQINNNNTNIHNITYLASAVISLMENLKQIETTSLIYIEAKFIEKFIKDQILKPDIIAILMNFIRICCNLVKSIFKSKYSNTRTTTTTDDDDDDDDDADADMSSFSLKQEYPEKIIQFTESIESLQQTQTSSSLPPQLPPPSRMLSSSSPSSSVLLKESTTESSTMTKPLNVTTENEKEPNLLDLCTYFKFIDIILKQKFIWFELNQSDKYDEILNESLDVLFIAIKESIKNTIFYKQHKIPINLNNHEDVKETTTIGESQSIEIDKKNDEPPPPQNKESSKIFEKVIFIGKLIEAKFGIDSSSSSINNNTKISNDDCSFLRIIPESSGIPMKILHSIGISLLRVNKFYPYAVTPLELFENTSGNGNGIGNNNSNRNSNVSGYQSQMRNANGKLPSIPVELLSDVDVLQKFVKRLSIFGFTSRQQFEEYFMTFLLLINKVYDENMVDRQEQFQIKSTCLEAILELLITYKTFPIVGNKLSQFHHTTRWSRIKCDTISSKKLHKVHLLVSNSNIFYYPNLERNLFLNKNNNIIGTYNFQLNQYDLNFIWQQMENHSININNNSGGGISSSSSSSTSTETQIPDEKLSEMDMKRNRVIGTNSNYMKEDVGTKNFQYFTEISGIDFKSSAQLIFDILTQLIENNSILVLPNLVKFCEICDSRDQVKWIKEKVYKLQEQIPIDDTISHQHIIYLMCKTQSILIPSLNELSNLCTIISLYLKSSHIFIRNGALHGLLSLLECCSKTNTTIGKLSKELSILRDLIVEYINRHGIMLESSITYSDTHTRLIWTLNFSLIEWTTKFVPDCHLVSNTIIAANNFLKKTTNLDIYVCILQGLERIIMINIAPQAMRNKIEKLALELVKMENETFSIPALKLLLSCMYMASVQQLEKTELLNGIVQDDPEIIVQQSDKVDILLHCIKSSTWSAAWIYGQVLCQILRDLVPPYEILIKVIKEFLAINQPHCDVIARIVNQVFRSAIDSSLLQMLHDWLICSLPTFLNLPETKSVWCLTVIFLSASINLHLIKLFPVVLYEFNKLGQQEISLFVTSAQDFYKQLNSDQRTRFIDTFKKFNQNKVFKILLETL